MAVTAKFEADFAQFNTAVSQAVVKFKDFESGAASVEGKLNRLVDNFSGRKIISEATLMSQAVERLGGTSKLTEAELQKMGTVASEAVNKLRALGQDVPKNLQDLATHAKTATSSFDTMKSVVTGLAGAFGIVFSVGAVISFMKGVSEAADALTKMHDKTGISVEGLQRMQIAGDDAGVTLDSMTSSVNMLQKRLGGDDKSALAALNDLGISLEEFKSLDGAQQMAAISAAVQGMNDPLRVAKDLSALFGKSWADQLPVLKRGFKEVEDGATVMSSGTVKALDDAGDAAGRMYRTFKANLGEALADILTGTLSSTRRDAAEMAALLDSITKRATAAAPKMAGLAVPGLPKDLDAIEKGLTRTAEASIKVGQQAEKAAKATERVRQEFKTATSEVNKLEAGLFAVPDALHKIGRGYDESKLGPLADAVSRIEQDAAVANFGFKGMTDALKNVGQAGEDTNDELRKLTSFEWSGPEQQIKKVATAFENVYGALDDVDMILSNIPGKLAEIGAVGARTGKAIMDNLAKGDLWGAIIAGATGVLTVFTKLFNNAEKQVNPVREAFVQLHGGLANLNKKASEAGVTLAAMLNAKNPKDYQKAIEDLNAALEFQDQSMKELDATIEKYGFSIVDLGPKFAAQKLNEKAGELLKDYALLNAAGIDHNAIIKKMGPALQEYVNASMITGAAIPENMRPILKQMAEMGLLTDAAGNKMDDLSKLTFTESLDEKFTSLIKTIDKLVEAITRGLGGALDKIPSQKTIKINYDVVPPNLGGVNERNFAASGGLVTASGIQHFAAGGNVLPFRPRGTDTVPAMLTPGEMVLTKAQQARLLSGQGGDNGATAAAVANLTERLDARDRRDRAHLNEQIQRIVKATIQTAGGRR